MEDMLRHILDAPSVITFTDNTRSMISVRRRDRAYHVRLHHLFRGADEGVVKAIAEYISGNSRIALGIIRDFVREHRLKIRRRSHAAARRPRITHQGRHFNLMDSFTDLNDRYFGGCIDCPITWGKRTRHSRRRSIRLGSFSPTLKIIRINPVLDREFVPRYVVDSITYHEMLHSHLGFRYVDGRRLSHYPEFKEMERRFVHYDRAKLWIKNNLTLLTGKS